MSHIITITTPAGVVDVEIDENGQIVYKTSSTDINYQIFTNLPTYRQHQVSYAREYLKLIT